MTFYFATYTTQEKDYMQINFYSLHFLSLHTAKSEGKYLHLDL